MPFIGLDWRLPGQQWVRDEKGDWSRFGEARRRLLHRLHDETISRNELFPEPPVKRPQTYIIFKENTVLVPLGEALRRLGMVEAVADRRKFAWVSGLVGHLLRHHLKRLSGAAQKAIICILEAIVQRGQFKRWDMAVKRSGQLLTKCSGRFIKIWVDAVRFMHGHWCSVTGVKYNVENRLVRSLLDEFRTSLIEGRYDHVGCETLWRDHWKELERMEASVEELQRKLKTEEDDNEKDKENVWPSLRLNELPPELIDLVLLRLTDCADLSSACHSLGPSSLSQAPLTSITRSRIKNRAFGKTLNGGFSKGTDNVSDDSSEANIALQTLALHRPDGGSSKHRRSAAPACCQPAAVDTFEEKYFKKLCLFHFPDRKLWLQVLRRGASFEGWTWKMLHQRLAKRFGLPVNYPDSILLCRHCKALFWQSEGHPCNLDRAFNSVIPPESFADLFAL